MDPEMVSSLGCGPAKRVPAREDKKFMLVLVFCASRTCSCSFQGTRGVLP